LWVAGGIAFPRPRFSPFLRLGVETGWVHQNIDAAPTRNTAVLGARGSGGLRVRFGRAWEVLGELSFSQLFLRVDDNLETDGLWGANVTVNWRF